MAWRTKTKPWQSIHKSWFDWERLVLNRFCEEGETSTKPLNISEQSGVPWISPFFNHMLNLLIASNLRLMPAAVRLYTSCTTLGLCDNSLGAWHSFYLAKCNKFQDCSCEPRFNSHTIVWPLRARHPVSKGPREPSAGAVENTSPLCCSIVAVLPTHEG